MQLFIPTMDDPNKPLSITEEVTNAVGSEEEVEDRKMDTTLPQGDQVTY